LLAFRKSAAVKGMVNVKHVSGVEAGTYLYRTGDFSTLFASAAT
jgi:hypothetical protein